MAGRQPCEDSAAATACRSTDTSSLVANLASWLSLSLARSKKRPFAHSAALGRERAARRRATIRSTAVAAASRSSIRAVHRASGGGRPAGGADAARRRLGRGAGRRCTCARPAALDGTGSGPPSPCPVPAVPRVASDLGEGGRGASRSTCGRARCCARHAALLRARRRAPGARSGLERGHRGGRRRRARRPDHPLLRHPGRARHARGQVSPARRGAVAGQRLRRRVRRHPCRGLDRRGPARSWPTRRRSRVRRWRE